MLREKKWVRFMMETFLKKLSENDDVWVGGNGFKGRFSRAELVHATGNHEIVVGIVRLGNRNAKSVLHGGGTVS